MLYQEYLDRLIAAEEVDTANQEPLAAELCRVSAFRSVHS